MLTFNHFLRFLQTGPWIRPGEGHQYVSDRRTIIMAPHRINYRETKHTKHKINYNTKVLTFFLAVQLCGERCCVTEESLHEIEAKRSQDWAKAMQVTDLVPHHAVQLTLVPLDGETTKELSFSYSCIQKKDCAFFSPIYFVWFLRGMLASRSASLSLEAKRDSGELYIAHHWVPCHYPPLHTGNGQSRKVIQ